MKEKTHYVLIQCPRWAKKQKIQLTNKFVKDLKAAGKSLPRFWRRMLIQTKMTVSEIIEHKRSGKFIFFGKFKPSFSSDYRHAIQDNFISTTLLGLDFDDCGDCTWEDIKNHPELSRLCAAIHTSTSHGKPGKGTRFFALFEVPTVYADNHKDVYFNLMNKFEVFGPDKNCKDTARTWFGNNTDNFQQHFFDSTPITSMEWKELRKKPRGIVAKEKSPKVPKAKKNNSQGAMAHRGNGSNSIHRFQLTKSDSRWHYLDEMLGYIAAKHGNHLPYSTRNLISGKKEVGWCKVVGHCRIPIAFTDMSNEALAQVLTKHFPDSNGDGGTLKMLNNGTKLLFDEKDAELMHENIGLNYIIALAIDAGFVAPWKTGGKLRTYKKLSKVEIMASHVYFELLELTPILAWEDVVARYKKLATKNRLDNDALFASLCKQVSRLSLSLSQGIVNGDPGMVYLRRSEGGLFLEKKSQENQKNAIFPPEKTTPKEPQKLVKNTPQNQADEDDFELDDIIGPSPRTKTIAKEPEIAYKESLRAQPAMIKQRKDAKERREYKKPEEYGTVKNLLVDVRYNMRI